MAMSICGLNEGQPQARLRKAATGNYRRIHDSFKMRVHVKRALKRELRMRVAISKCLRKKKERSLKLGR
eukprot:9954972-Alexandrium_andersonii.AAC.1